MNITTLFPFIFILPWNTVAQDKANHFFDSSQLFMESVVSNGQVDYANIKRHPELLNQLTNMISEFDLEGVSVNTQIAFMINAYNILVIKGIVDKYPVSSPMKINGFFDGVNHYVAGKNVSLNTLEKKMLFKLDPDPRLHFILVCAAVSCPKLASEAYTPEHLEDQIENVTRAVLNDPVFIREENGKVLLSEIFRWYASDFKKAGSALEFINQYRGKPFPSATRTGFYNYDWKLNDQALQ